MKVQISVMCVFSLCVTTDFPLAFGGMLGAGDVWTVGLTVLYDWSTENDQCVFPML